MIRRNTVAILEVQGLKVMRGGRTILHDINARIAPGCVTALIGPNGSGKSTLMAAMAGMLPPAQGRVMLNGTDLAKRSRRDLARELSFLPQQLLAPDGLTLRELLVQGRFPRRGWLKAWTPRDEEAVTRAVALCDLSGLMDRRLDSLSGGQLQRGWIAMTLAQDTPVILLDEPTTFLDIASQLSLLDLLANLRKDGRTIITILHDLNQTAQYADQLILMRDGHVAAQGPTSEVFTAQTIGQVFSVGARMLPDPVTGRQICLPASLPPAPSSSADQMQSDG
ncbi:ABC transporter ATP-binding protein [Xinfangfangia sp. D13-10-4-6]|uniref:ABC transporter ATP-binding protein n=1 Tax=Pseudogemmobacter hezensis TaxID=2737662 RepID=UPI001555C4A7|nr:ABC transporter ATP-binding protein [Pseudogemmobacter hezensis]NPD16333.1 ABC transporter ATP-binding protein [Pseudogemmobacter hezensis]